MFWYAVHTLAPLTPGLGGGGAARLAGGGAIVDAKHVEQCISWLQNKAPHWYSNRRDFERAGLLVDGGEGEAYGIPVKFRQADALLARYCGPHVEFLSKTTEKGSNSKESRAVSPKAGSASVDVNCDESESVKLELNVGQAKDLSWNAAAGASQHHSLPLPSTALGSASDAVLADNLSNLMSEQEIESFLDGVDNDGGLSMHSERYSAPQVYPPYRTYADRRPVVNLLLDLMSSVGFDTQVCFIYKYTSTYPLPHMCCVFGSIQHMNTTHLSSNCS